MPLQEKACLTVNAATIRNKTKLVQLIHKILQGIIGDTEKLRFKEALDNPEAVPIINLSEPTTYADIVQKNIFDEEW